MKKIITVAFISTLLVILSLFAINAIIAEQQKDKQREIATTLLHYSEDLAQNISQALKGITAQGCSKESLDDYRKVKLDSHYFADVGFIEDGKIRCTAFWGKLATPLALPRDTYTTPSGFVLANISQKDFFTGNASIYKNMIIFTSRYAYDKFSPVTASYSLSSTTKNGGRTFFATSPSSENKNVLSARLFTLRVSECSANWDLCVIVSHHDAGLASLSLTIFILLCACLYFIWLALALFTLRLYEDRFSLERSLVKAIKENAIGVNYQPIMRIRDQKVVGVEVLSRWRDKNYPDVSPELFIPLIEKMGRYTDYYTSTIKQCFSEIAGLALKHQLIISLNVGRTEIEDGNFINFLRRECLLNNIPLSLIKIELSEKAVAHDQTLDTFCKALKSLGVKISIDDFGVQNSNIARLSQLEYDEIKIDKSLVDGISEHYKQDIFVIFCDALAKLNKTLVFEGVETEIQYAFIAEKYRDALIQGWYFSKSLSRDELAKLMATSAR